MELVSINWTETGLGTTYPEVAELGVIMSVKLPELTYVVTLDIDILYPLDVALDETVQAPLV